MMREFSQAYYGVDVLKVEVPVNMNYVEGYAEEAAYTKEEAAVYFKEQAEATDLPYIFLSAGVSAELFQETLQFAKNIRLKIQWRTLWTSNLGKRCRAFCDSGRRCGERVAADPRTYKY